MNVEWPEPVSAGGRLMSREADDAWMTGYFCVGEPLMSCQQTLETVSKRPGGAVNLRGELLTSGIGTTETEEMAKPIIDDELWT
ncbi:hypothetical protein, partial [Burkholderia multivorans]|uniref:hypothetical protein n=1 Tax=Burkholderia multivorans TaxID=87883 RepID=UPI001C26880A